MKTQDTPGNNHELINRKHYKGLQTQGTKQEKIKVVEQHLNISSYGGCSQKRRRTPINEAPRVDLGNKCW